MTDLLQEQTSTERSLGPVVTKAVIPAAGLGTRFLPATKATPKEMLPVVDKPAIQYVVEEAVAAGLSDVLVITGRNKRSLEDHFDRAWELEETLQAKGDASRLARVQKSNVLADMHYTRQGDPRGLGHAVLCADKHVGDQPFAVLLGDDLIDERDPLLVRMIGVQRRTRANVVALLEVPRDQVHLYGCAAVEETGEEDVVRITGMVEKPDPADAPSNLAVIGRYVLHPRIFEVLRQTEPGRGGEIQITDALQTIAQERGEGGGVYGVVFRGRRYDTGDRLDYLKAVVQLASERADLGPRLPRLAARLRRGHGFRPVVISVDRHLADCLAAVAPLPVESVPVARPAAGCSPRTSPRRSPSPASTTPPWTGSPSAPPTSAGVPLVLPVSGESAAGGGLPGPLAEGSALRIMTGAPLPHGADAVIPVEWTGGWADRTMVRVDRAPDPGRTCGGPARTSASARSWRPPEPCSPLGTSHCSPPSAVPTSRCTARPESSCSPVAASSCRPASRSRPGRSTTATATGWSPPRRRSARRRPTSGSCRTRRTPSGGCCGTPRGTPISC